MHMAQRSPSEKRVTMGMTMTQKILAAHAGLDAVHAGQLIEAGLDMVMGNDVTTPPAIEVFRQRDRKSVV